MTPRFHRLALQEYVKAIRWYGRRSEFAPGWFVAEVQATLVAISQRPETFPLILGVTRRARVKRFPYSVLFDLNPTEIVIIAIAHGKRGSAFWRFRSRRA